MEIQTDEDVKKAYMLIHGHNTDFDLLELDQKLVDLAVALSMNDDYEETNFVPSMRVQPRLALKSAKIYLNNTFRLHNVFYASNFLLKIRLNGRIIKEEKELVSLYNKVGVSISPFMLPVKYVDMPYYYGNLALLTNLSDEEDFLKKMKLFFERIDLGMKTNAMTSVCYVHEIIHTQVESLKGIVRDYYNSELLSIFCELLYASCENRVLLAETLKNRIHLFFREYLALRDYVLDTDRSKGEWNVIVASKYIVSTLKAFNLFEKYTLANESDRRYIIELVQQVFDGNITLEEMLEKVDVTYEDSLSYEKILNLIYR